MPKQSFGGKPAGAGTKAKFGAKKAEPAKAPEKKKGPTVHETTAPKRFGAKKSEPKAAPDPELVADESASPDNGTRTLALPSEEASGQFDRSDIVTPSLKLVHSMGPLSETFEAGGFVLNGETPISDGAEDGSGSAINFAVLRIRKQFEENTEWGSDEVARIFDTIEQVREAGGHIEWHDNEKPPFSPILTAVLAIECPSDTVIDAFPYEHEGKNFALALYKMKGSAYTRAAKPIITANEMGLKGKLSSGRWSMITKRPVLNGNPTWVPVLKRDGVYDEETRAFFNTLLG